MSNLITVVIPVYNVEKYLDRCMQSVLSQTYSNLEIIIVDDKSDDNSNSMCLSYLRDERVIVIHGNGEGLSGARNVGIDNAHGKFIVFIDSDDYIESTMIEKLYMNQIETGADAVIGGYRRKIGDKIEVIRNPFEGEKYADTDLIKSKVLTKMLGNDGNDHLEMSVWKILFSMDIITRYNVRFPDKKYLCEDIIFDFGFYPHANLVSMCDDSGYCYCLNDDSLSQMYQKNKFDRLMFQSGEMRRLSRENGLGEEAEIRIDCFLIGNLIHHMKTMAARRKYISKNDCMEEYKRICSSDFMEQIRWDRIDGCFSGRDNIPFALMKKRRCLTLYYYLRILTIMRGCFRKY